MTVRPRLAAALAYLLVVGCVGPVEQAAPIASAPPPASSPVAPVGKPVALTIVAGSQPVATAVAAGLTAGPAFASLAVTPAQAAAALATFRLSCPALLRRADTSGLTQPGDWAAACTAAATWTDTDALRFFATMFETVRVGAGTSFATGYYEPEIAGSRTLSAAYPVPVYAKPPDLIEIDLGAFRSDLSGKSIRGRIAGTAFVPYYDRAQIETGALAGHGLELAYAADPVEFFFLQVQGSGRLRLPDGSVMRIGYAGQNGRPYIGIGALMRDRGMVPPNQASMQGIMALLRAMPDGGKAIMDEDGSYVFFRELTGAGPIGALGVPVTARASVAADPKFVPLGAPIWLSLDRAEATGLWVAQDTGGAIKGANRVDTFWGAGDEARRIAGGMSGRGQALLLVPVGTLARAEGPDGGAAPQR